MKYKKSQRALIVIAVILIAGLYGASANATVGSDIAQKFTSIGDFFKNLFKIQPQPVPTYKPVEDYENAVVNAVKKVSPAVVAITISKNVPVLENCQPYDPLQNLPPELKQFFGGGFPGMYNCQNGSKFSVVGGGSGFIVSQDGLILTNKHVVADAKATYTVFTNDGRKHSAKVLARDPLQDLAVVKIDGTGYPTAPLGDSDSLELGQTAIAIGNALGEFRNTVSVGVISGLSRSITATSDTGATESIQGVIQTDTAINPGNSGGTLVNLRGEVVGINVAIVSGAQNIGFALPVNWAKHDIDTIMKGGQLKAAYLGVRYVMVTPDLADEKHLDSDYGALITSGNGAPAVIKNSPGDKAGLKDGDIIIAFGGKSLKDNDLLQLVAEKSVGDKVELTVLRKKETLKIAVVLAERGK